jgi:hypothetical protein
LPECHTVLRDAFTDTDGYSDRDCYSHCDWQSYTNRHRHRHCDWQSSVSTGDYPVY